MGFQPKWRRDEMPWMPKGRYAIMRDYMPKVGSLGLDMMTRTCTVQVNLDFASRSGHGEEIPRVAGAAADRDRAVRRFAVHRRQAERLPELPLAHLDRHRSRPHRHARLRVRGRLRLRALRRLSARRADVFHLSRRRVHRLPRADLPRFPGRQAARAARRDADAARLVRPHDHRVPGGAAEEVPRDARRRRRAVEPAVRAAGVLGRAAVRRCRARRRLGPGQGFHASPSAMRCATACRSTR